MDNKPTTPNASDPRAAGQPAGGDAGPANELDQAVAARLAKLRAMPIDLTALQAAVGRKIPRAQGRRYPGWLAHPLRLAAAFLIVSGLVAAIIFSATPSTALASPEALAAVHQSMVDGPTVDSVEAATAALRAKWPAGGDMPAMGEHGSMACCVHKIGRKNATCVAMKVDQATVTVAVARESDVKIDPATPSVVHGGVTYRVQSADGLNMAMTQRNGLWLCVMGNVPVDRLIDLAAEMKM